MGFLEQYEQHVKERAELNVPALPLSAEQTAEVIELIKAGGTQIDTLKDLLFNRVPPGVDDASYVKAAFLNDVVQGKVSSAVTKQEAVEALGQMLGGYNVQPLVDALKVDEVAQLAADKLKNTLLVYDSFNDVAELSKSNTFAKEVVESWANGEWFTTGTGR